jgi:hypothetical protein
LLVPEPGKLYYKPELVPHANHPLVFNPKTEVENAPGARLASAAAAWMGEARGALTEPASPIALRLGPAALRRRSDFDFRFKPSGFAPMNRHRRETGDDAK